MEWRIINGPPGIGKSKFSRALANNWRIELISTDSLLEQRLDMTIEDYINSQDCSNNQKWINFRKEEYKTLQEIEMQYSGINIVLDLGGGLLAPENIFHKKEKSLNEVLKIRDKSKKILNSNGILATILPYENLEKSLEAMEKFTKIKIRTSRPSQGNKDPIEEMREKLKLRWESYNKSCDIFYFIFDEKPKKGLYNDEKILELQNLFEEYLSFDMFNLNRF